MIPKENNSLKRFGEALMVERKMSDAFLSVEKYDKCCPLNLLSDLYIFCRL
jgi:hypothetical protein